MVFKLDFWKLGIGGRRPFKLSFLHGCWRTVTFLALPDTVNKPLPWRSPSNRTDQPGWPASGGFTTLQPLQWVTRPVLLRGSCTIVSYAEWPNHPFDSSGTVIASRFQASPTLIWAMLSTVLCCIYAVAQLAIWAGRSFADIQVHRCWTTDQNLRLGQVGHPEASGARPAGQTIKPHHPWMLPPGTRTQYDGVLSSSHSATGSTVKAGEDALSLWLLPLMRRFQISGESQV